jgi:hypothetical protein
MNNRAKQFRDEEKNIKFNVKKNTFVFVVSLLNTFNAWPAKIIKPVLIMNRLMYCRAQVSA